MTRRGFVRAAGKGLVAVGGLVVASRMPGKVEAAGTCPVCGFPWGPLHNYLGEVAADFWWQHNVIVRESGWDPGATNPSSGAAGLAQFMPDTWAWGEGLFGIYGSPYNPYDAIKMMSAFVADGQRYHWYCNGERGCADV